MAKFHLIVGSVMGTALEVAQTLDEELEELGHDIILNTHYQSGDLAKYSEAVTLICSSTTGIGDLPENIVPLHNDLVNTPPRLINHNYLVVALGDSSYPDFAQAGKTLDEAMEGIGGIRLGEPCVLDAMLTDEPQEDIITWIRNWHEEFKNQLPD